MKDTVPIELPYNHFEHFSINEDLIFTGYGQRIYHKNKFRVKSGKICAYNRLLNALNFEELSEEDRQGKQRLFENMPRIRYSEFPYFCSDFELKKGDSGGPLMLQVSENEWIVVGIASSFFNWTYGSNEGIFVAVAGHLPWIRSVIESE